MGRVDLATLRSVCSQPYGFWLDSAVAGLLPLVAVVEGAKVGSGRPGPLTRRLREFYEAAATAPTVQSAAD